MIEILLLMFGGMLLGYLLRQKKQVIRTVERLTVWCIFLLLFFMGLSIGHDPLIFNSLPSLGVTALIISASGIVGSLFSALILWKYLFKKKL